MHDDSHSSPPSTPNNPQALFAPMVVDAISLLDPQLLDISLVGVKKVPGGSVTDSFLVQVP